jgi:hypothetical protein
MLTKLSNLDQKKPLGGWPPLGLRLEEGQETIRTTQGDTTLGIFSFLFQLGLEKHFSMDNVQFGQQSKGILYYVYIVHTYPFEGPNIIQKYCLLLFFP